MVGDWRRVVWWGIGGGWCGGGLEEGGVVREGVVVQCSKG